MNPHREQIKMELRQGLESFMLYGDTKFIEENIARYRRAFRNDNWLRHYLKKYSEQQEKEEVYT